MREGVGVASLTGAAADLAIVAAGCACARDVAAGEEEGRKGVIGEGY